MAETTQPLSSLPARQTPSLLASRRFRTAVFSAVIYLVILAGAFVLMIPFAWMVSTSLKQPGAVFDWPPKWIPEPVVWSNYPAAWNYLPFTTFLQNTLIITITTVFGQTLSASLVAYSFARLRWIGRNTLFLVVLATLMLPFHITMIPVFAIWKRFDAVDTLIPLIVPAFLGGGAFNIFLMRQFFMTIPPELDDAAKIDGCGVLGIYGRIILPLSKPVIGTVAIFSFLFHWNDFLGPLIYLNSIDKYTLALGLRLFQGQYNTKWELLMAASVIVMMPVLLIYFLAQRYFVQGIVFTGIKG
ncbi:MAG TPA: carbohydrate ABC transporter permease [Caldilineaceae bacterium]|nr:carbohydrate ABC transporter permease [Caldilineaceae bacterium]